MNKRDIEDQEKKINSTFTYLSLICGILILVFLASMSPFFSNTIKATDSIASPTFGESRLLQVFVIVGWLATILSLAKKEPWNVIKWITVSLNLLLFIIVFFSICFYFFVDFTK